MLVQFQLHEVSAHLLAHFLTGSRVCKRIPCCSAKRYRSAPSQDPLAAATLPIIHRLLFVEDNSILGFNGLLGSLRAGWAADNFKLAYARVLGIFLGLTCISYRAD